MGRILLVSNRLSVTIEKRTSGIYYKKSVGGLATGLSSFYKENNAFWIGWCGLTSSSIDGRSRREIEKTCHEQYSCHPIFLTKRDLRQFYAVFCNKMIWPLFHYFTNFAVYDNQSWEAYKRVNRQFAQDVLKIARPDDIIWVHDYHLMLLPRLLRAKLPDTPIGFFLHIPFPSYELFRQIPWRQEILHGLLGADLIGFHTYDYVRHFLSSVRRLLGYDPTFGQLITEKRIVKADAFPMGIDFQKWAGSEINNDWINEIQSRCRADAEECRIILSVDRLDYTKGIPERLEAFDVFLEKYPEYKKRVTLIMVAVPSRITVETYRHLKQHVDELVGRINGKHGTIDWMPVWYLYRGLPPDKLCSLYNIADVALVTPLRDGMNLIAKEYVAAKKDENGVLVLSEMAGAVSELAEAVIVNPNNREEVADALQKALNLSEELRREKIRAMKKRLERYNVEAWARDFIRIVGQVTYNQKEISTRRLVQAQQNTLIQNYRKAQNRLIFLDYDGTLVPFQERPEKARPDEEIYALIQGLVRDTKNEVILVSGRDKKTLDEWFGHLNIGLSAEHGVWIKINRRTWAQVEHLKSDWKEQIRPMLEIYVDRTPGSFIEEKSYSLAWHYRKTNPELGMVRARELREEMLHITANLDLMVLEGSKVIEVKSRGINKGRAAMQWMNERKWDFILAFGDDWTDEDLFEALPESAHTIKIGLGVTKARFYVTDYTDVRQILNLIVKS